ncbi:MULTISPECIES: beta-N-acetylhexosaminidase [Enterobacter]|uniref:beta-N-acetylhexosaminidase n=1 Tax=Enterobacter TaxID=547 RepID=UPI0028E387FA|nr:family 20 glycosylhydrolase [Enterobacter cloacae]WNT36983.1 family 20 glycosylhydrolase [Enterobacter cloacae]HDR2796008.1 beta-N-acetylhexosaminidase [Enterobacter asburiae]HDR2801431.1 beta-N-acetylhexosaminidase [Enterobacter asburiae]
MLRYSLLTAGLMLGASAFAAPAGDLPLMPWPAKVERPTTQGALVLSDNISVIVSGDDLGDAVNRLRQRIALQTGWTLRPQADKPDKPTIRIDIAKKVKPQPLPDSDESYTLKVDANGVNISANTRFGALRGMETLLQLIQNGPENTAIPWVTIEDAPRFPWRGLLLDSARHFIPLNDIKRQIDGMAAAKLNVLHWHLTDDQGWRFTSKRYPKLTQLASDGQFYTPDQMREIVRYATDRGIRVVPEIDMPGHASAIAVAYPELMSAPGPYEMERHWGVLKPVLDPTKEATYSFAEAMVSELAAIFPDPYLHIGGDEVDDTQWKENAAIQKFMRDNKLADSHALQAYFNRKLETLLEKHHRQMVGWDEIFHPDLPKSILIQSWQGQDALGQVAEKGYKGILSTGFYLDQPQSTAYHYRNEIVPQGLNNVDVIGDNDSPQSWAFTLPRLKGKPVEGSFTLVKGDSGWRGFIDFAGKSRRAVQNIEWRSDDQVTFTVDTWMGETRPVVTVGTDTLSGYFLLGNARYPVSGKLLDEVPKGIAPVVPDAAQQANLLGGEAALWAENVVAPVLDIKLWPRTFAVAERLWSAQDVNDTDNMYTRLQAMDSWSTVSVGLQQHSQQQAYFTRLANNGDSLPLLILAQAVEPAQYYTRQHLKFQAGNYHQFEPLNRFADALSAESATVRQMNKWVDRLVSDAEDTESADALRHVFNRWQSNTSDALALSGNNYQLRAIKPVIQEVDKLASIGLRLTDLVARQGTLDDKEIASIQAELDNAAKIQDEVVIAAVYPLETLLRATRNQ